MHFWWNKKKRRGQTKKISSRIDNAVGARNIANHFSSIFKNLYNNVNNGEKFHYLCDQINRECELSTSIILRIDENLVKKALDKMKPKKSDSIFNIVSDQFINAPPQLTTHLTRLMKIIFLHGYIPDSLLLCSLFPLVKDNLGDVTKSDNYRAIAGGCLLLKVIDLIIIILESEN